MYFYLMYHALSGLYCMTHTPAVNDLILERGRQHLINQLAQQHSSRGADKVNHLLEDKQCDV